MSEEVKKDLTQAQLEGILKREFGRVQDWQNLLLFLIIIVPIGILVALGFGDVHIVLRIVAYVILGITLMKCEEWAVQRRIRKTIEAMKAL